MSAEHIQIGTKLRDAAADPNAADENIQLGTPSRDAAVDPRPGDYQAPVSGESGQPVSVQALSPRSGNPPLLDGVRWVPPEQP
jgi:hypothetical protein